MLSLRELEAAFRDGVFDGEDARVAACLSTICANGRAPQARLAVYRNSILHNYGEALRDVYPVIEKLVGEDFFRHAARQYIHRYPSNSNDVHRYGGQFAEFLESFPPARSLAYLRDVARLEWLWHESFHAAEHTSLSLERLAAVPAERHADLSFTLHPSCRLLASPFPIHRIWAANQPDAESATVDLDAGGVKLLIRRRGYNIELQSQSAGHYAALSQLAAGRNVIQACESAYAADPQFDFGAFLQHGVIDGLLVDFAISDS